MEPFKSDPPSTISVLTANLGNNSLGCRNVLNKLCYKDVEDRITKNIQSLTPDIVALQEVLAPWQCLKGNDKNPNKVCADAQDIPQVRRLLGDEYSIICNSRNQFECIAVRTDVGDIIGCDLGSLCNTARTTPELLNCDNGFNISAGTIQLRNGFTFDVVNFHPQSTNSSCRARMIKNAFDQNTSNPIITETFVLLLGDFNLDPWRDKDESVTLWNDIFENRWGGRRFQYHSGIAERNPPHPTSTLFFIEKTVDFIVSNFANGTCYTLGESPGTFRLDGGKGTDHRAVYGILNLDH